MSKLHGNADGENITLQNIHSLLKSVIAENKMLREENNKMYTHFSAEFIALKKSVDNALAVIKNPFGASLLPRLPIETTDELVSFEKEMQENIEMKTELISRYKKQPHNDLRKFIFENLKLILSDELTSSKLSWTNANGNISVKNFTFIKILADVAVENIPQTSYQNVEGIIKKYFGMTKDRINKAIKRHAIARETTVEYKKALKETLKEIKGDYKYM